MGDRVQDIVITGCGWVTPFAAGRIEGVLAAARASAGRPVNRGGQVAVPPDVLVPFAEGLAEVRREDAVWLAAAAVEIALADATVERSAVASDRIGLVLGVALAGQSGMIDFANDVREQSSRFVSPIRFPQTVGNYVSGALARAYDLRGPSSTIARGCASSLESLLEGASLLRRGEADLVIAGGTEKLIASLVDGLAEPEVMFADGACLFVMERMDQARGRGAKAMGVLVHTSSDDSADAPQIVSTAGYREEGAIFIEERIGRMPGGAAAAALAAAIGGASGLAVPIASDDKVEIRSFFIQGDVAVEVRASDDRGVRSELSVVIPSRT